MTRNLIAVLVVGAACWPAAAGAHWQYTKWGMTPDQVQNAAKGKLSPVTGPADACPSCTTVPLLAGDYDVAGQVFRVRFEFSGQSLAKVVLAMQARRQSWGCNGLFDSLTRRYGAPAWQAPLSGDGSLPNARWIDQHDDNTVFFNDIWLQTGMCEVQYSPLAGGLKCL